MNKIRCRVLAKYKLWAYFRSLWKNLVRIEKLYYANKSKNPFGAKLSEYIINLYFNLDIVVNILAVNKNNHVRPVRLISQQSKKWGFQFILKFLCSSKQVLKRIVYTKRYSHTLALNHQWRIGFH